MDDLRQGVTPAGHDVLDCLERQQAEWSTLYDVAQQLRTGHARARSALYAGDDPVKRRRWAVEAAARLIDAINRMDRDRAPGDVQQTPS